ncbi:hypothetical protein ACOSP7_029771 [Xanthoceras sorbifolium]
MASKVFLSSILLLSLFFIGGYCDVIFFFIENKCTYSIWHGASPSNGDGMAEHGPGILKILTMTDPWTGLTPTYPVTLLNFGINKGEVSHELNLNHGFNIPVSFRPDGGSLVGGSGACPVVDCVQDLKNVCPSPLVATDKDGFYVGCNSACDAMKDPKFCCTGEFTGSACQPNEHSRRFKEVCKLAHTYPGDNEPPVYKCSGATRYNLTFCPF